MNVKKQFKEGLITNNPVLVQLLGMCSTMAITTTLFNGIGMGVSVIVILTCSNIVISPLRGMDCLCLYNAVARTVYLVVVLFMPPQLKSTNRHSPKGKLTNYPRRRHRQNLLRRSRRILLRQNYLHHRNLLNRNLRPWESKWCGLRGLNRIGRYCRRTWKG